MEISPLREKLLGKNFPSIRCRNLGLVTEGGGAEPARRLVYSRIRVFFQEKSSPHRGIPLWMREKTLRVIIVVLYYE